MSNTTALLFQAGPLAITSNSLPSLVAIPVVVLLCLWLSARAGAVRATDAVIVLCVGTIQVAVMPFVTRGTVSQFSIFSLSWPILGFLSGYATWRVSGLRPLRGWPWYRFGLVVALLLLYVDVASAFRIPPAPGRIWQLGGAGLLDTLVLGPPFFMLVFYGLLDCHSPLVFCSRRCRDAKRCLHHSTESNRSSVSPYSSLKRTCWATALAVGVLFGFTAVDPGNTVAATPIPEAHFRAMQRYVVSLADSYGVPHPELRQTDTYTVAFTGKTNDGSGVVINIGSAYSIRAGADFGVTKAVLAHEMGHVVLFAQDKGYPNSLVLALYVLTLAALIWSMPSRTSAACFGGVLLTTLLALARFADLTSHQAIKWTVVGVLIASAVCKWRGRCASQHDLLKYMPSPSLSIKCSTLAALVFFAGMPAIGALNTSRELFADRIAACEAGVSEIERALTILHPKPSNEILEIFLDPFHPTVASRRNALHALDTPSFDAMCRDMRKKPISTHAEPVIRTP